MSPLQSLRATAKSFIPGSIYHAIKRVTWNPLGITNVRSFDINEDEVIARGRTSDLSHGLHDTSNYHKSKIKRNNESEAVPFKIPKDDIPIIPIIPPAYTAPLYRTNTIKGVKQEAYDKISKSLNIKGQYRTYDYMTAKKSAVYLEPIKVFTQLDEQDNKKPEEPKKPKQPKEVKDED